MNQTGFAWATINFYHPWLVLTYTLWQLFLLKIRFFHMKALWLLFSRLPQKFAIVKMVDTVQIGMIPTPVYALSFTQVEFVKAVSNKTKSYSTICFLLFPRHFVSKFTGLHLNMCQLSSIWKMFVKHILLQNSICVMKCTWRTAGGLFWIDSLRQSDACMLKYTNNHWFR